jgi:hypothetical protein
MEYDSSSSSSSRTSGSRVPEEGQSDDDQEYQGGLHTIDVAAYMNMLGTVKEWAVRNQVFCAAEVFQ